ncbi:MAG: HAD family hydrolase [Myxococcota bacterium]
MARRFDAVLLDFGGVFTPSPFTAFEDAARALGAAPERVLDLVFGPYDRDTDHPWHRLERGESDFGRTRRDIMEQATAAGIELDPLKILAGMSLGGGVHAGLVERVRGLRADAYRTGLVTNNAREFRDTWRPLLPLDELFDTVVDSSEVGLRKPDPRIFELALARVGDVPAERAVFLDDFEGNVAAAERVGMTGILVGPDVGAAIAELDRLLGD